MKTRYSRHQILAVLLIALLTGLATTDEVLADRNVPADVLAAEKLTKEADEIVERVNQWIKTNPTTRLSQKDRDDLVLASEKLAEADELLNDSTTDDLTVGVTGDCPKCPKPPCCRKDACCILYLPAVRPDPVFNCNGIAAFDGLFRAAAARGVENAVIRAMNATHVCPICKTDDCIHTKGTLPTLTKPGDKVNKPGT